MFIIAGFYRRQRLATPKGAQTRPTASRLREAVFNICQREVEGAHFLDLFAGSGAMGFEALSRGAKSATFVDWDKEAIACIRENAAHLKVEQQCQIIKGEVLTILNAFAREKRVFDLIYVDPPYYHPPSSCYYSRQILEWVDSHELLTPEGLLFMEEGVRYPPTLDSFNQLELKNSRRIGEALLQLYTPSLSN